MKPILFSLLLKNYTKEKFFKDIISGIIVAIIALPLSIALAIVSGVTPERGLYTAIVAGFLISFLGGSNVQISGPTAAFATIINHIVISDGFSGLVIATIIAGFILVLFGIFKFGNFIKYIPYTITTGFTSGISATIFVGQLKDFFGLSYVEKPITFIQKINVFFLNIKNINYEALFIGILCLIILIFWKKISKRIPGSLIAIIISIIVIKIFKMNVKNIGDLFYISDSLPKIYVPFLSFELIQKEITNGFSIAILAAIESLLSAVVADSMTSFKHKSNQELIAQGIGNIGSAFFGGIPATGAIARTAANIKNGGQTPISGIIHSVVLFLILIFFMPYVSYIPMPAIAAILFQVAYNMCQWKPFKHIIIYAVKQDIIVLLVTFFLTIFFNLIVAITFGLLLSCFLFVQKISEETHVNNLDYKNENIDKYNLVKQGIHIYEITGPMFFGIHDKMTEKIITDVNTKVLILRMRNVTILDITAFRELEIILDKFQKQNIKVILSHVNEQPMLMFKNNKKYLNNIKPNIHESINFAKEYIKK